MRLIPGIGPVAFWLLAGLLVDPALNESGGIATVVYGRFVFAAKRLVSETEVVPFG